VAGDARDTSDRQEPSAANARFDEERRRLWMRRQRWSGSVLLHPPLALELGNTRVAFRATDRAEHEMWGTDARGGVRDGSSSSDFDIRTVDRRRHCEHAVDPRQKRPERNRIREVTLQELNSAIAKFKGGRGTGIAHERPHFESLIKQCVDDGTALFALAPITAISRRDAPDGKLVFMMSSSWTNC
jgi:hypothetical protein